MEPDKTSLPAENTRDDKYVDERTREKIHKHIADPNSRITEEDIANVNTDIFARPEEELTDEALKGDRTSENKEETGSDDELPPKAPTTWDVLE